MKHQKRIGPLWQYDEDGCPVNMLGDVEWHAVTQKHKGKLAAATYLIDLDRVDDRRLQAIELSIARKHVREFIGREG